MLHNDCWLQGFMSLQWRISKILPFPKLKKDSSSLEGYRTICLLSFISKAGCSGDCNLSHSWILFSIAFQGFSFSKFEMKTLQRFHHTWLHQQVGGVVNLYLGCSEYGLERISQCKNSKSKENSLPPVLFSNIIWEIFIIYSHPLTRMKTTRIGMWALVDITTILVWHTQLSILWVWGEWCWILSPLLWCLPSV